MKRLCKFWLGLVIGLGNAFAASAQTAVIPALENSKTPAGLDFKKALTLQEAGATDSAYHYYRAASAQAEKAGEDTVLLYSEANRAMLLTDAGKNVEALEAYQKALLLAQKLRRPRQQAVILNGMGTLYSTLKKFDQATLYLDQAEDIASDLLDFDLLADIFNNKGLICEQQGDLAHATRFYENALLHNKKAGNYLKQAVTLANLAIVYKQQGAYPKALAANEEALQISRGQNDWMAAATLNNIAGLYDVMGNYPKALTYGEQSVALARKIAAQELVYTAMGTISEAAEHSGNYQEALRWQRASVAAKDSFINEESSRQLSEAQVRYQTAEKEKQLAETQVLAAQTRSAIQRQRTFLLIALGGLVLLTAVGVLVIRNLRLRRRHAVQVAQLEALQAQKHLQEEKLRIGRELHDNVGSQLTFVASSLQSGNLSGEALRETSALALQAIRDLRSTVWFIHHECCTVEDLVVKLREYLRPTNGPQVLISQSGDGHQIIPAQISTHLLRIIQEAVNNAVKHSGASQIKVCLAADAERSLQVTIHDNGQGFDAARQKDGFGLKNMAGRTAEAGGTFLLQSVPGEGTTICLHLPLPAEIR